MLKYSKTLAYHPSEQIFTETIRWVPLNIRVAHKSYHHITTTAEERQGQDRSEDETLTRD